MFRFILLLSLLVSIFISSSAFVYVTGSNDTFIKIWNDSSILLSRSISKKITCLEIDFTNYSIIAGTDSGKLVNWNIQNNSTIIDNGNETAAIKSILIINSSLCLAGYNGFLIFWSIPELKQIDKKIDTRFGTMGEMKYLDMENVVLIVNEEKNMIVFSLNNSTIIKVNQIKEKGYAFDAINRSFIFAPCIVLYGGDCCLFNLKNDYTLNQINLTDITRYITFPSMKILNESFGIFSSNDGYFGYFDFRTKLLTEKYKSLNKILSMDFLNDKIIAGHFNGSISHISKINFNLIKTFSGHSSGYSTNVVKKFISYNLLTNILSTTSTSTIPTTTSLSTMASSSTTSETTVLTTTDLSTMTSSSTSVITPILTLSSSPKSVITSQIPITSSSTTASTTQSTITSSSTSVITPILTLSSSQKSVITSQIPITISSTTQSTITSSSTSVITPILTLSSSSKSPTTNINLSYTTSLSTITSSSTTSATTILTSNSLSSTTSSSTIASFNLSNKTSLNLANFNFSIFNINGMLNLLNLDIDLNDCISNCSGNGVCKFVENGKFVCECFENYMGKKCDLNTIPCSSNPCINNASCINNLVNRTYTCECYSEYNQTSLYFGNNCEYKVDICANEKCSNNGVCFDSGTEAKCKCFQYYNGIKCEIESSEIKNIKHFISTSSLIAIVILVLTYCCMILCDLCKLFNDKKRVKSSPYRKRCHSIQKMEKLIYIN